MNDLNASPWTWDYCFNCCKPTHLCKCDEEEEK